MGWLVEGLRIARGAAVTSFAHEPVMLSEVVELLAATPAGIYLDCTLGGAGHARALLEKAPQLTLVGIDKDPDALHAAQDVLADFRDRIQLERGSFARAAEILETSTDAPLSAVLMDLGVSSPQLDRGERGFSYKVDGPLDMRMDPSSPLSAEAIVNAWPAAELARLFSEHGETRMAGRIARAVVEGRPLRTTTELADVVTSAIPAALRRSGGHPARRVFQALRVAVNDELVVLGPAVDSLVGRLAPAGRFVVLSYHSGEDRIVKDRFRWASTGGCTCPPQLPCVCGAAPKVKLMFRGARRPSQAEVQRNHRAKSARMRAVEGVVGEGSKW
ncbi:MAG: 16S rRNA (cytosine(1402)-N(4))-methyltransferase RsmH [Acidimicrobiales bacterium]